MDLSCIDHVVFATPDLAGAVSQIEGEWGVRATPGGAHVGLGTRNALISLGPTQYLEIIGPDPGQPVPRRPRPFGIDDLQASRIVTWASATKDIDTLATSAREAGHDVGMILDLSRKTPDGTLLSWRLSLDPKAFGDGTVPFIIEWGETVSPAETSVQGCILRNITLRHPEASDVTRCLNALGLDVRIEEAIVPKITIEVMTPKGVKLLSP